MRDRVAVAVQLAVWVAVGNIELVGVREAVRVQVGVGLEV